jgi:hypothetical protein
MADRLQNRTEELMVAVERMIRAMLEVLRTTDNLVEVLRQGEAER